MPFVGVRFTPRIRDLREAKHFLPKGDVTYGGLKPMISNERLNIWHHRAHWNEILRTPSSIQPRWSLKVLHLWSPKLPHPNCYWLRS